MEQKDSMIVTGFRPRNSKKTGLGDEARSWHTSSDLLCLTCTLISSRNLSTVWRSWIMIATKSFPCVWCHQNRSMNILHDLNSVYICCIVRQNSIGPRGSPCCISLAESSTWPSQNIKWKSQIRTLQQIRYQGHRCLWHFVPTYMYGVKFEEVDLDWRPAWIADTSTPKNAILQLTWTGQSCPPSPDHCHT